MPSPVRSPGSPIFSRAALYSFPILPWMRMKDIALPVSPLKESFPLVAALVALTRPVNMPSRISALILSFTSGSLGGASRPACTSPLRKLIKKAWSMSFTVKRKTTFLPLAKSAISLSAAMRMVNSLRIWTIFSRAALVFIDSTFPSKVAFCGPVAGRLPVISPDCFFWAATSRSVAPGPVVAARSCRACSSILRAPLHVKDSSVSGFRMYFGRFPARRSFISL